MTLLFSLGLGGGKKKKKLIKTNKKQAAVNCVKILPFHVD